MTTSEYFPSYSWSYLAHVKGVADADIGGLSVKSTCIKGICVRGTCTKDIYIGNACSVAICDKSACVKSTCCRFAFIGDILDEDACLVRDICLRATCCNNSSYQSWIVSDTLLYMCSTCLMQFNNDSIFKRLIILCWNKLFQYFCPGIIVSWVINPNTIMNAILFYYVQRVAIDYFPLFIVQWLKFILILSQKNNPSSWQEHNHKISP